jgi:hypothetical protein
MIQQKNLTARQLALSLIALFSLSAHQAVGMPAYDMDSSIKAFQSLLAISNEKIPKTSSCFGQYNSSGAPTVKDLLAIQLENLSDGENVVSAGCLLSNCEVSITHNAGESVSSALIKFTVKKGRAQLNSLQCIMTP